MSHSDAITGAAVVLAAAVWSALSKTEFWKRFIVQLGMAPGSASLGLLAMLTITLLTGCSTVTPQNIAAGTKWAEKYYDQPNVAEIFHAEGTNVCVHITGATLLTISTPVPAKSIIPREPSFFEGLWDAVKTCAPYAFMYGIFAHGGIGNSTSTTVNNAAATP